MQDNEQTKECDTAPDGSEIYIRNNRQKHDQGTEKNNITVGVVVFKALNHIENAGDQKQAG
jgi:hypothetical protein